MSLVERVETLADARFPAEDVRTVFDTPHEIKKVFTWEYLENLLHLAHCGVFVFMLTCYPYKEDVTSI